MRRTCFTILFLLLAIDVFGQGTVITRTFYSNAFQGNQDIRIYYPEGYSRSDTTTRYPVIYFLHGATHNYNHPRYNSIFHSLDSLISAKIIDPVFLVLPNGYTSPPFGGNWFTNSALFGPVEDYITTDLIEYMANLFVDNNKVSKIDSTKRAVMGWSMGGFGAMQLALKHPELYQAVASHSGPIDFASSFFSTPQISWILQESGSFSNYKPENGLMSQVYFSMAGAFSPNLQNPPYNVDFLLNDKDGTIIDSTLAKWMLHDPSYLARQLSPDDAPAIYFDCGQQDAFENNIVNQAFADSLDQMGIEYEYQPFEGGHGDKLDERMPIALKFIGDVFRSLPTTPTGIADQSPQLTTDFTLAQNYPNPFNPRTAIRFSLPQSGQVQLNIYNAMGQIVRTLLSAQLSAGEHAVQWDGTDAAGQSVASGLYFYQLEVDRQRSSLKKMVLLK